MGFFLSSVDDIVVTVSVDSELDDDDDDDDDVMVFDSVVVT